MPQKERYEEDGASNWVQSHQVFPLYLGAVPAQHEASVVAALVADIKSPAGLASRSNPAQLEANPIKILQDRQILSTFF